MSQVIIAGDTSGTITLQAPAVSGSSVLTLPAATATLATLTTPSFASTIGVGGATASASGSGISFPATQSASSDANTLDDYEEGTWTPSVGGTATYQAGRYGRYVKVGKMVTVQYLIAINIIGTGSTTVLQGLPFASENISSVQTSCVSYFSSIGNARYWLGSYVENNATTMQFVSTTGLVTTVDNATGVFTNNTFIYGFATYMTNT